MKIGCKLSLWLRKSTMERNERTEVRSHIKSSLWAQRISLNIKSITVWPEDACKCYCSAELVPHNVLAIHVQPIHMLECTTLQKAVESQYFPSTDKVDSDVLLCVAKDNNNLGKAVRKVPENHGQPPDICICAVHWWRGKQGRSWLIGSILSMEMSAYITGGEAAGSLRQLVWRNSHFPSSHETGWQLEPTFDMHIFHISLRGFTEQT